MDTNRSSIFIDWTLDCGLDESGLHKAGRNILLILGFCLLFSGMPQGVVQARDNVNPNLSTPPAGGTFSQVETSVQQQLTESLDELAKLRDEIKNEKIPLGQKLSDLEDQLLEVRREYQQITRLLDSRTLDLTNLRTEIQSRREEKTYLSNLLDQYIRNFETRLHIAEIHRYSEPLEAARLAIENSNLSDIEVYQTQAELVTASLERLYDALGGTRFDGSAVDTSGLVKSGTFILVGPAAMFRSQDGKTVGTVEQRLGSLEPTVVGFESPEMTNTAAETVASGAGRFPLDPTLGNAHKIEATKESLAEHIKKGGPVMYPILTLACAALLVALFKWVELARFRKPSEKRINALLHAVAEHDDKKAVEEAAAVGGPTGQMLSAGVEHIKEPPALIEEVMYEKILSAKMKLQRFLPFVAISAAAAPLLGLLGTVTGIINTFKLITVFGSGDVKTLSGGISEALITTEFGLIIAIPSLLLHAFLSRKARGMTARMEKAAIALINQISKTPYKRDDATELLEAMPKAVAREVIRNLHRDNVQEQYELHQYSEDSAGGIMDPVVVSIGKTCTVAEAIGMIRTAEIDEDTQVIFVVDEQGRYLGDVYIHKLLTRPEQTCIESLVNNKNIFVRVDTHRDQVRDIFRKHNSNSMPVLNYNDQLVGRITADRVNGNRVREGAPKDEYNN
jgi:biopolymer transport protein ExbB